MPPRQIGQGPRFVGRQRKRLLDVDSGATSNRGTPPEVRGRRRAHMDDVGASLVQQFRSRETPGYGESRELISLCSDQSCTPTAAAGTPTRPSASR
jgi:hypothetical protein